MFIEYFKNNLTFKGRRTSWQFNGLFWFYVVLTVIWVAPLMLISYIAAANETLEAFINTAVYSTFFNVYFIFYGALAIIAFIAAGVKRLHDFNKSGWWLLLICIPIAGQFLMLYWFFFKKGDAGDNRFGPNPQVKKG
ncbi:MAG: DUF805 domain-containing protein [Spirochaetaceae bacterium]|nr:DUF805 domain-containing protein [Spirochaetaceae bacterium]